MALPPQRALHACALPFPVLAKPPETVMPPAFSFRAFGWKDWAMALPPQRALHACALPFPVMATPPETVMPPAFSFRASDVLVPEPGQTPKANRRPLETLSQSLLNFSQNSHNGERQA